MNQEMRDLRVYLLRKTIREKWSLMDIGWARDEGRRNCDLCQEWNYWMMPTSEICKGCPVCDFTGVDTCWETPYERLTDYEPGTYGFRRVVNMELMFLQMLLEREILKREEDEK